MNMNRPWGITYWRAGDPPPETIQVIFCPPDDGIERDWNYLPHYNYYNNPAKVFSEDGIHPERDDPDE